MQQRNRPLDKETVKNAAAGRWQEIYESLGIDLHPQLYRLRAGSHVAGAKCPVCGARFWLSKKAWAAAGATCCAGCGKRGDGIRLVMDVHQISFPAAIDAVATALGLHAGEAPVIAKPPRQAPTEEVDWTARQRAIDRLLATCQPVTPPNGRQAPGDLVSQYLRSRGLPVLCEALHDVYSAPSLIHCDPDTKSSTRWGGMVAAFRDPSGQVVTLHRTYLDPKGCKAQVSDGQSKKLLTASVPSITGGAVRLTGPLVNDTLHLAEGLETALAVYGLLGWDNDVWSTLSAALLAGFEPPQGVRRLVVWADKDRSLAGVEAAETLRERMTERGIAVEIRLPPLPIPDGKKGIDWLDAWNAGFRLVGEEIKRAA